VSSRRFDTDDMLQRIMENEQDAFTAFYERYRGRIYRFIVRQYGNGDFGKAGYYAVWRHMVIASRTCDNPKDLKLTFYRYLGQASKGLPQIRMAEPQSNYLPRDLEEDSKWSLVFIEHFKRLPNGMKKRYLFKHELCLNTKAIALVLDDSRGNIEKSLEEAECTLRFNMDSEGCPSHLSLDKLYRESRVVKPPAIWNDEVLSSYKIWLKQAESPRQRMQDPRQSNSAKRGLGGKATGWFGWLKRQPI